MSRARTFFKPTRTAAILAGCLLVTAGGACSLLLDHDKDQCTKNADCTALVGGPGTCVDGVCVAQAGHTGTTTTTTTASTSSGGGTGGSTTTSGTGGTTTSSSSTSSGTGGTGGMDGGPLMPPGCFTGTPTNNLEYANACTKAQCVPFDNCARLGLCDAGTDAGASVPPPTGDGGTTSDAGPPPAPTETCYDSALRPNPIYITGSTNLPPLLADVAPLLAANNPPYTVVFFAASSCAGADSIFSADPTKHVIKDKAPYASYYAADGSAHPCLLNNPAGITVDVGESDIFASTCNTAYTPGGTSGVAEYRGPIQPIAFVVNAFSLETSISAEAAHMVFGLGGNNGVAAPWTDPTLYFTRSKSTGTNLLTSAAISVPPAAWWGIDRLTASALKTQMSNLDAQSAQQAIGVLSADSADSSRTFIHELFFQQTGQLCGFLPDSTPFTRDKINVRDGHYQIWGPMHFYATVDANHQASPAALAFVERFAAPVVDRALLDAIIDSGLIPACAMKVTRTQDMGPLSPYPYYQCGCYYDNRINGTTTCQACTKPADCPASHPACNNGFCEIR